MEALRDGVLGEISGAPQLVKDEVRARIEDMFAPGGFSRGLIDLGAAVYVHTRGHIDPAGMTNDRNRPLMGSEHMVIRVELVKFYPAVDPEAAPPGGVDNSGVEQPGSSSGP